MKYVLTGVLCLLWSVTAAWAGSPGAGEVPEFKKLKNLIGEWRIDMELRQPDGTWKAANHPTFASLVLHKNGYIRSHHKTPGAKVNWGMEITYSYNKYGKFYQLVTLDEISGLIDMFRGHADGDAIVFDNLLADTTTPNQKGESLHWRVRLSGLDEGKPRSLISVSTDAGKTWRPAMRGVYQRVETH
ncbi:DUF1579 family protein [Acanthopleuribacter pedis]|uniref:DUF1579 family protein n=1 Tax=Acanthopleuribacter pedis TaxID=442870 RepID=A0A8J7QMF7_9BACT|nr:DUF1579 family protein [Acanthopleuribacter pedis]MBO1321068.1 DUF1579 family protein [Acanthopleuribacter pedis]